MFLDPKILFYALLGGILPTVVWLLFWLREDKKRPEPTGLIILSFIAGGIAVVLVYPIEKILQTIFTEGSTMLLAVWAATEEIVKFLAILFIALKSRFFDDPVDALVYMITVALGFAAIENTLFILTPLLDGDFVLSYFTGNLRFLGATLLHTAASALVGISLGLVFYRGKIIKTLAVLIGLGLAILLHTAFNFFIIENDGENMLKIFSLLWASMIVVIFFFEVLKKRRRTQFGLRNIKS